MKILDKIIMSVLSSVMYLSPLEAQDNWLDLQLGYNAKDNYTTAKTEGGLRRSSFDLYGVLYLDATERGRLDLEKFYTEISLSHGLGNLSDRLNNLDIRAELNSGNSFEDVIRFGVTYDKSLWDGNYTLLKLLPIKIKDDKEIQGSIFFSQDVSGRLTFSSVFDYNTGSGGQTYYFEPEINFRLERGSKLFLLGIGSGALDDILEIDPIIGVKFLLR